MYGETTKRNPRHHPFGLQKNKCFVVEENHPLKNVVASEYLVSKGIEFKKDMDLVMYACACVQTARGIMFNVKTQITVAALEAFNPGACTSKDAMGLFALIGGLPKTLVAMPVYCFSLTVATEPVPLYHLQPASGSVLLRLTPTVDVTVPAGSTAVF